MDVLSDAVAAMRTGVPHASRTHLTPPWGTRFQPQDGAGFHAILQGSCWLLPARGEPIRLDSGDIAFLPRELGHAITDTRHTPPTAAGPARPAEPVTRDTEPALRGIGTTMLCGAYRLDRSRIHPLLAEMPDVVHLRAHAGANASLRGAVNLLDRELTTEPLPGSSSVVSALLEVLLLLILRTWHDEQTQHTGTGWGAALRDPAVAAALRAIHRDPAHPWTVQSLAAHAGLSRSSFAQRFTATVGSPPLAYLTWWRLTTAARTLRDTALPLRSVAERAGYTSEYAFAKAFKREFDTAPGQYRNTPSSLARQADLVR
ncbi:AraC family transcriptional regulator [Kitasatospora sp. NPDC059673]|uniref:AraC family transcriptional regulator n=1 Tax=Kitasatospora sp. NPDC059673 TaxID=3346901 RepID=UPI0036BFE068